jgi:hypothetical protein
VSLPEDLPQLLLALAALGFGGLLIVYNAAIFWATQVRKGDAPSAAPIFGGVLAAAGVALLPFEGAWKWAWLPLLLDWGGLPMLLHARWTRDS